jgi:hypothetical protein
MAPSPAISRRPTRACREPPESLPAAVTRHFEAEPVRAPIENDLLVPLDDVARQMRASPTKAAQHRDQGDRPVRAGGDGTRPKPHERKRER